MPPLRYYRYAIFRRFAIRCRLAPIFSIRRRLPLTLRHATLRYDYASARDGCVMPLACRRLLTPPLLLLLILLLLLFRHAI